ncbi:TRAPPC10 domain protein [Rhizoctonia solani 123E]|uniref:TRAPPC10 domain protein n=1 Tax=Rhizoctonia solani 123E TaxID=1423351 RepID=A0A074S6H4_9AGAM|nr:TRAPPC10 domain protein [Rhizoctonia solani 123E]
MQLSSPSRPASISSRAYTPSPISPGPGALASNGNVKITYTLAHSIQSSPHFAVLLESLRSRIQPLRNLHWKPSAGTLPSSSIRTIQSVDAEFVPLDLGLSGARLSAVDGFGGDGTARSQIPGTVLAKPFINLWLGMCEDADTYKNVVRRQLKDWVASVTTQSKRDQEWLIVLVHISSPGQDAAGSGGKRLFQMKGNVIDRMRADFTLAKRDRCVQLNYVTGGQDDPAAWTELIAKIKDAIITTLDSRIAERIDDVRRTEAQRAVPGWNFCTFFVLKESIAESFEGMTLLDAALLQYSELEASFYQVLKEKNLSWFGKLGGTTPGDDAAPLLSVTKKPYRDLILSNNISIFDFRCYLVARQCLLLAKMGAIADVANKATGFISAFSRTLRENENSLSEPFIESWIYSCALNVVDECDGWMEAGGGQESLSDAKGTSYSAAKCELLELARAQLDKIGIRAGHLPRAAPFSASLPDQETKSQLSSTTYEPYAVVPDPNNEEHRRLSRLGITNANLLEAIDNVSTFDNLYKQLVTRTIETCRSSGRSRTAMQFQGTLAALYLHRGDISSAQSIYAKLPIAYANQHWNLLEGYMRFLHLETSKNPEDTSSEELIIRALALLSVDLVSSQQAQHNIYSTRIQQTLQNVFQASSNLSSPLRVQNFSLVDIKLTSGVARLDNSRDGSFLDVIASSRLPEVIEVFDIKVHFKARDGVHATFGHKTFELSPGTSSLSLFCPDPISGLLAVSEFEYQISGLLFRITPPESEKPVLPTKSNLSETRVNVRVPEDKQAAQVMMQMPRHVILGDQRVLFKVCTGRNILRSGTMSVVSPSGQIKYNLACAKVLSDPCGSIKCTNEEVSIDDLPAEHELVLSVPFSGSPRNDELEATLNFVYTTVTQPEVIRTINQSCKSYIGLPLIVNINDKFRDERLFTNVVVHSANQELIRIAKVALLSNVDSKLAVQQCTRSPVPVPVWPSRPAPWLFQIQSSDTNDRPNSSLAGETLKLKITYRSLREDLDPILNAITSLHSGAFSSQRKQKLLADSAANALLTDSRWANMLELLRQSPKSDPVVWAKELVDNAPIKLDFDSVLGAIKEMREIDADSQLDTSDERSKWRTVTMPFDVPSMSIVNRVKVAPRLSPSALIYAGQPLEVTVTIEASFHWSGSARDPETKYTMHYDVLSDMDSGWLINGPKRGEYIAQDQSVYTLNLTLLPLRHGVLSLPVIMAEPGDDSNGPRPSCETWQSDGAQRITVLPRNSRSTYTIAMPIPVM